MNLIKKIKNNMSLSLVLLAYLVLLLTKKDTAFLAVANSEYYLIEMLMIMPVIFVLTALLDIWVPKETISKFLGENSKTKGAILSFVLGGISAGPIYAAFPICIMLFKKGATIRNIVIILSSWAVIKIPMLLNELKFLGFEFMITRWVLTVIAILIFSWITSKIVKKEDIPDEEILNSGVIVNQDACMGCRLCVKNYPEVFEMNNRKANVLLYDFELDQKRINKVIKECPASAISNNE